MNDKKCGASEKACKVIAICPAGAISYKEVKEPITDRTVNCTGSCGCGCDCGTSKGGCGGSPFGRIVIDYENCIECGLCADECCGQAIEMTN